jgi:ADP-ribose pyrophosphatase YjhB (NUDIX family)
MDIFSLLDSIQSIARNGLYYTTNEYDKERYERLLSLTSQTYSELLSIPEETVKARFLAELGYITPKVGTNAAIFNEKGEILLMERIDGSGWCMPCGFVEPNETPTEGVVREVREETGLDVKIKQLVGIFTRKPGEKTGPHTFVSIVYLCDVVGGQLRISHEGKALNYWVIDEVNDWHATHEINARAAYKMWKSDGLIASISV